MGSDIAVYTALFGWYDKMEPAPYPNHILFTSHYIQPENWQVRYAPWPHPSPGYSSRYYFSQPCLNLPDCEYTIMHGANATLATSPRRLIAQLPPGIDIAAHTHPRRSAYAEAKAVVRMKKAVREVAEAQMARYREEGFPEDFPLTSCALLIRRNTERMREFESLWWQEIQNGSCRDQLSFDYCRWKLGIDIHWLKGHWQSNLHLRPHYYKVLKKRK